MPDANAEFPISPLLIIQLHMAAVINKKVARVKVKVREGKITVSK